MSTSLIFLLIAVTLGAFYFFKKKSKPQDVELDVLQTADENMLEPIVSYAIYTVDAQLNHRYQNYTHKDFPNHVGILKGQYLEIDWNIFNADLITISGVGLVKSVGRKAFYPTENTAYTITAKNKLFEISQTIYVRIFPLQLSDKLLANQPKIHIHSQYNIKQPEVVNKPLMQIIKPEITYGKVQITPLHNVLQNKITIKTFTQKIKNYIKNNSTSNK